MAGFLFENSNIRAVIERRDYLSFSFHISAAENCRLTDSANPRRLYTLIGLQPYSRVNHIFINSYTHTAMKILALISQKGGVGKTTLATALAVAAQQGGQNVALFDLDDQATAAFWGDIRADEAPPVKDVKLALLARDLEKARNAGADLVILDCPPVHAAAISAAEPADFVLIPTKPALFDIRSMRATLKLMQSIGKRCGVVLTFCPVTGSQVAEARQLVQEIGAELAPVDMHQRVAYQRAQEDGRTPQEYEPDGKAAAEVKALYSYIHKALHGDKANEHKAKPVRKRA